MTRRLQPCGTPGAASRHYKAREFMDPACAEAQKEYLKGRRNPDRDFRRGVRHTVALMVDGPPEMTVAQLCERSLHSEASVRIHLSCATRSGAVISTRVGKGFAVYVLVRPVRPEHAPREWQ